MWWIPELLLEESRTAYPQAILAPKSMAMSSILLATRTQLQRRWPPLRMGPDGRGQNEHIQLDGRDTRLCWPRHTWLNSSSCMNDFYFYKEVLSHFFENQWLSWSFVFPLVIEA